MLDILSITGVIFILIGTGFLTVRLALFTAEEVGTLGKFVVTFALPALIFRAVSSRPLSEIWNPAYLLAVLIASLAVFAFGFYWSRKMAGNGPMASTFWAMGMSCSNSGFVGYPVLLMALPSVATTALALNMVVENLVMIPLILTLIEFSKVNSSGHGLGAQILGRLARNPIVIAFFAGIAVMLAGIEVPLVIARPIELFAASSAAVSLVAIGGSLAAVKLRGISASLLMISLGKLVLLPLAVAGCLALLGAVGLSVGNPDLAAAAIIMAGMPVMAIYPILAQRNGEGQTAAVALLAMTVFSMITISAILALVT